MARYSTHMNTRVTPQTEQAAPEQQRNSAGGFSFVLDCWSQLDRWLILGSVGNTYYAKEAKLVKDNMAKVQECLDLDGLRAVARIVEISTEGRAAKNAPAIFALAMASGHKDLATRKAALGSLSKVCRTGTDLFLFLDGVKSFRGWGRSLRQAVMAWYTDRPAEQLGYQVVKYQQRDGMSHRDVLRLAGGVRAEVLTPEQEATLRWIVSGMEMGPRSVTRNRGETKVYPAVDPSKLPSFIRGWEAMKAASSPREAIKLITDFRLTHEMVKSEFKGDPEVWVALLENMPLQACLRNLAQMTANGALKPMSASSAKVVANLTNQDWIKKSRLHPLAFLSALRLYSSGHGLKGKLSWTPIPAIEEALNEGFYLAFGNIVPSNKRELMALDVSGSMTWGEVAGIQGLTPHLAAAAMAMATVRTESNYYTMAFSTTFQALSLTKTMSLQEALKRTNGLEFAATDCAQPMLWATQNKVEVDTFRVYTDSETQCGRIHAHQALEQYRQRMGIPAKLVVVGMVGNPFTIANPKDAGMLDVVGFDTNAPSIMNDFSRGEKIVKP